MVKVQVELSEKANQVIKIYMARKKLEIKNEAVNKFIEEFGDDFL